MAGTAPVANGEPVTVMVLGADGPRTDGVTGTRVDTILLARLDPGAGRLSLLSLPRDLMVTDPAGVPVMINSVAGDLGALVGVVEQQIGIPIDHVVRVDFRGGSSPWSTASAASTCGWAPRRGTPPPVCSWTGPAA